MSARKIVIIGAGVVGTTFAYALQINGGADEIVLIDIDRKRVEGEVLDLNHGLMFTSPVRIRAGDYDDCAGADVVVITAGAKQKPGQSRLALVETNVRIMFEIVEKVVEKTSDSVLLVVSNPVDILTYAALKASGLPKQRVIGSGTVLDSARFRYLLSSRCRVDPHNVHAYVLGEHGDSEVMAWSMTHIAGTPIGDACRICDDMMSEDVRGEIAESVRDSAYHIIDAKGATNYAVGLALVRIVRAIIRDENSILTVSTLLDGEFGIKDVCIGAPTVVNSRGADRVFDVPLSDDELKALRASANSLKGILGKTGLQSGEWSRRRSGELPVS